MGVEHSNASSRMILLKSLSMLTLSVIILLSDLTTTKYFQPRYQPEKHGKHWKYPLGELFNTLELDDFGAMISSTLDLYMHPLGEKKMEYLDYAMEMGKIS